MKDHGRKLNKILRRVSGERVEMRGGDEATAAQRLRSGDHWRNIVQRTMTVFTVKAGNKLQSIQGANTNTDHLRTTDIGTSFLTSSPAELLLNMFPYGPSNANQMHGCMV